MSLNIKYFKIKFSGMNSAEINKYFTDQLRSNLNNNQRAILYEELLFLIVVEFDDNVFPCIAIDWFGSFCSKLIKNYSQGKKHLPIEFHYGMFNNRKLLCKGIQDYFFMIIEKQSNRSMTKLEYILQNYGTEQGTKASLKTYISSTIKNYFIDAGKKKRQISDDGESLRQVAESGYVDASKVFLSKDFFIKYKLLFSNKAYSNKKDKLGKVEEIFQHEGLFFRETFFEEFSFLIALHPQLKDIFSKSKSTDQFETEIRNLYLWNKVKTH